MTSLVAATIAFLATHFVTSTPLRPALVRTMGQWPYIGAYSLVALLTLVWMSWAYAQAPREILWVGFKEITYVLTPVAFIFIACGYGRNPRGIIRVTRHPIMWGLMLWAAAHIAARGDLKSLVFFGGLLVVAAAGTLLMDSRKRANPDFVRFAALSSNIPFVAILQGRNRLVWREIGWLRPAIGIAAFGAVLAFHP